ncbi:MAG: hypothetical protein J3Q66DRAFT_107753 [Benniella sp.]|nr:MAG: hypothetical protein J3Q66DRAFT_107753 [Benniella sp.]
MQHIHHLHRTQPLQHSPLSQSMQTSQPRALEPTTQYEQQFQESFSHQGYPTRKRSILADMVEPMDKKRWKGAEAGSSGSFTWLGLLGTAGDSTEEPGQGYFERRSTSQYDPATPPLDPGPFQASVSANPIQFPSHQQDQAAQSTHEQGYNFTLQRSREEGVRNDMDVEASCSGLQSPHEGVSIRSLSPAPSSPSGSIHEYEGMPSTNLCPASTPDPGYLESKHHSHLGVPTGRTNFVMGFRPGCERCQRREKGHFAHFE